MTFHQEGQFKSWLGLVTKKKYALYLVLTRGQLIAEPQTSTQPVRYGIFESSNLSTLELEKVAEKIAVEFKIQLIIVTDYEFSGTEKV